MDQALYIPLQSAVQACQQQASRKHFDNSRVRQFAERHRLCVKKDGCGKLIAPGKHGHLFDYGDGECFGMVLEDNPPHQPSKAKALLSRRRQALAAGFTAAPTGGLRIHPAVQPAGPGAG